MGSSLEEVSSKFTQRQKKHIPAFISPVSGTETRPANSHLHTRLLNPAEKNSIHKCCSLVLTQHSFFIAEIVGPPSSLNHEIYIFWPKSTLSHWLFKKIHHGQLVYINLSWMFYRAPLCEEMLHVLCFRHRLEQGFSNLIVGPLIGSWAPHFTRTPHIRHTNLTI